MSDYDETLFFMQARYSNRSTFEHELSFDASDVLRILESSEPFWIYAELGDASGWAPENYLVVLQEYPVEKNWAVGMFLLPGFPFFSN